MTAYLHEACNLQAAWARPSFRRHEAGLRQVLLAKQQSIVARWIYLCKNLPGGARRVIFKTYVELALLAIIDLVLLASEVKKSPSLKTKTQQRIRVGRSSFS